MCNHLDDGSRRRVVLALQAVLSRLQRLAATEGSAARHVFVCPECGQVVRTRTHRCDQEHAFVLDTRHKLLYCFECRDIVYDRELDRYVQGVMYLASGRTLPALMLGAGREASPHRKRRRLDDADKFADKAAAFPADSTGKAAPGDAPKTPDPAQPADARRAAAADAVSLGAVRRPHRPPAGVRGLVNLGNTCFIASVLQALLHAPTVRSFFLGGAHPRTTCARLRLRRAVDLGGGVPPCMACEVEALFSQMLSPDGHEPVAPAALVTAWSKVWPRVSANDQQDAHEFFLALISEMVEADTDALKVSARIDKGLEPDLPQLPAPGDPAPPAPAPAPPHRPAPAAPRSRPPAARRQPRRQRRRGAARGARRPG
ncbi:unnamed protein product [Pedinophyceae sp. YPF-701]|nr:unnamed protein product [Pedinophyceae sp. YPF-701]